MLNRFHNLSNPHQNYKEFPRMLCVCSAGLLRSPTMAYVFAQDPYNFNTRAVGLEKEYALLPIDEALVEWADIIVVAQGWMGKEIEEKYRPAVTVLSLDIPDKFPYRDPELIKLIKKNYANYLIHTGQGDTE